MSTVLLDPEIAVGTIYRREVQISVASLGPTIIDDMRWSDLTELLNELIDDSGIKVGLISVQTLHTTTTLAKEPSKLGALLGINEAEEGLVQSDIPRLYRLLFRLPARTLLTLAYRTLRAIGGRRRLWRHDHPDRLDQMDDEPMNAHSHLLCWLFGKTAESAHISGGKLRIGTWQRFIFYDANAKGGSADGELRKNRTLSILIIGSRETPA